MSAMREAEERVACTVQVLGHVQGVGFRWRTAERARALGVCGRVRNARDGSVLVFAEGTPAGVEALVEWLAHGPSLARVERLWRTPAVPEGLTSFEITA